jgi:hypothetical protein
VGALLGTVDVAGFDKPHLAVKKLVHATLTPLSADAVVAGRLSLFPGHRNLLLFVLRRVGAAGLRAFDVAGLDEPHLAADSLVQAALATGSGLGVDAVVARLSFASFASRHDSTSYRWGSHVWLLFQNLLYPYLDLTAFMPTLA